MKLELIGMNLPTQTNAFQIVKYWTFFCTLTLGAWLLFYQKSGYMEIDALGMWILSCLSIFYLSRKTTGRFSDIQQKAIFLIGILMCLMSFLSIPLGITNPPYTIGEFSLLLSGIGVVVFCLYNFRSLVLPVSIPFIAVAGYSAYELFIRNQDWITAPIIPVIVIITTSLLRGFGISVNASGNIISFISLTGSPISLAIVSDCTGIWSMGTFSIAAIIVLSSFPESITRKSILLICIGYIGTFCANIVRILLVALSGYFFGPVGIIEQVHVHIGWICFSVWMIIFWYYYFTRQVGISFFKKKEHAKNPRD